MTETGAVTGLPPRNAIGWVDGKVRFIDQRRLPSRLEIVETDDWRVIAEAIRTLAVRGAPLIGIAAAYGVALAAAKSRSVGDPRRHIEEAADQLAQTRPTAVNLFYALGRMRTALDRTPVGEDPAEALLREAVDLHEDDRRRCEAIGTHGLELVPEGSRILTVCNAGFLATGGTGTALAVVYRAHEAGRVERVFACETRPLLQGARLTAWELTRAGIPVTLLVDSTAAGLIAAGGVDLCIIGADRIAAQGDVANKVGSYQVALSCREHRVPFYVAAPLSTIDPACPDGSHIPIEMRRDDEVTCFGGDRIAAEGAKVYNPAFDIVPAELVSAIITEETVHLPPFRFHIGENVKRFR